MFNPMERIRKLSGMPAMSHGYPPKTHRKCSDWASYVDAVDTVTRELVDALLQCQASGLKTATDKAKIAGELAEYHDLFRKKDQQRALAQADHVMIEHQTSVDVRDQVKEAIVGVNGG
jgi:hypothetical protein